MVKVYEILGKKRLLNSLPFSALKLIAGFEDQSTRDFLIEYYKETSIPIKTLRGLKDCVYVKDVEKALSEG